MKIYKAVFIWIFFLTPVQLQAAEPSENTIVLLNVSLPDSISGEDPSPVSLLIKDGKLDLITRDPVARETIDQVYDASNGNLVGVLELGSVANFLLITSDVDPVVGIIDTKLYSTFAIVNGEIIKNTLSDVIGETVEERRKQEQGWLAYTPPPRISMTDDANINNWNRFQTYPVNGVFAAAVVLDRQHWLQQDNNSLTQVGDLKAYNGGEIRGLRFGGVGSLNFDKPWVWTLFAATHAFDKGFDQRVSDDFSFFDVRLDIPIFDSGTFSVGMQKEPISMERIMSMVDLPQQERSTTSDALLPSRNTGIVIAGNAFNDNVSLAGGIFNNFMEKNQPNSFSDNATQFVGRATWVAFSSEDESTLLHMGAGVRLSDLKEGGATSTEPEFNKSPDFLYVDSFFGDSSDTLQFELSARSGPFWLHSEYVQTDLKAPALMNPSVSGYHATLSWIASGEMRPYSRSNGTFGGVPISRTVNQNGWGAWELSTRFSHTDLTDGLINGGEVDIWSAGINWWMTDIMNINVNYRYITLDKNGTVGHSQGFNTRLVLILE